jgi:rubrerythrin
MKKIFSIILYLFILVIFISACSCGNKSKQSNINDSTSVKKNITTIDNLKAAITQESNAIAKYTAYAIKAKEEGYMQIQLLFEAISKATMIHVSNLSKAYEKMGGKVEENKPVFEVKTTKENLEEAIKTENNKTLTLYSQYIKTADKEGVDNASIAFNWTNDTKLKHIAMLNNALNAVNKNLTQNLPAVYYVCPKCGNTFDASSLEDECSFCGTGKDKYILFK